MRRCRPLRSLGRWADGLRVPAGAVAQIVQPRTTAAVPVRSLVAQRRIRRGERLCVVPMPFVLDGAAASCVLRRAAAAGHIAAPLHAVQRCVAAAASGDSFLLSTRDALLEAIAIVFLRRGLVGGPLAAWAQSLPPRPPLPLAALSEREGALVVAQGVQGVQGHCRRAFFMGRAPLLSPRSREAAEAQRRRDGVSAAQRHAQWNAQLHSRVIAPLAECLAAENISDRENISDVERSDMEEHYEALRWAHFMVRSRAVNLDPRRPDAPRVAIVPFVDMLNHSARAANVSYSFSADEDAVVVVAARTIDAGEELTLCYSDYAQRGALFARADSVGPAAFARDGDAEMRRVEERQRREWDSDSASAQCGEVPFGAAAEEDEAVWLWRFGFARDEEELAYVESQLWSSGLRERIAHLTDVRRRGRPGEFVVGIPEGLRAMREQRARIERERYGGVTVFPPQNTTK